MKAVMRRSVLTVSACALLLAGCTPIVLDVEKTLLDFQGKAHIITIDDKWSRSSRPCQIVTMTIDGNPQRFGGQGFGVVPGAHVFVVAMQWSNGWQDQTELTFEA